MTYSQIDPTINSWVRAHSLALFSEFGGEDRRFWFTSRGRECFQISIDPPSTSGVIVHAWSVETDDDAELHGEWTVKPEALNGALKAATALIELWAQRVRMSA